MTAEGSGRPALASALPTDSAEELRPNESRRALSWITSQGAPDPEMIFREIFETV